MTIRTFVSGQEKVLDSKGVPVAIRLAVTVWEGDDRDRSGMRDLGTEVIEIPLVNDKFSVTTVKSNILQAAQRIIGKHDSTNDARDVNRVL